MKAKALILGVIVAVLGIFSITAKAQTSEIPVKVLPGQKGMIKVIYSNAADEQVEVKFSDDKGLIRKDKIENESFDNGFAKNYRVQRNSDDIFWVEINSQDITVTYKMTSTPKGQWSATLEKADYHPVVASN